MRFEMAKPYKGAIVRVKVKFYYHYGIYIDEKTVVAFGLPDNSTVKPEDIAVISTDIETFLNCGFLEVAKLSLSERLKKRSRKKIIDFALNRVGTKGYNILHNNCEHFVNECVFGKKESSFVESVRDEIKEKINKQREDPTK